MNEGLQQIDTRKMVLKAAESVWAANKYFVLACNQQQYLYIRRYFRHDQRDLPAAFALLKKTEETYQSVHCSDLPELTNALYHVMGYFKKLISPEQKQFLNTSVQQNPRAALDELERLTFLYHVEYLLTCRLWQRNKDKAFNEVPMSLTEMGYSYAPYTWLWYKDHLIANV